MQSWRDIFSEFNRLKVLIIGDVMVDAYIWGVVERMSPEAPVPVVHLKRRDFRLGGAANVALNVLSMGAQPILCSLIGQDEYGKQFSRILEENGISKEGIVSSSTRPTTVKARVIASHQHVVRIDDESDAIATETEEKELMKRIEKLLPSCQVVIFEDYDKGAISPWLIENTIKLTKSLNIPTVVDPKKRNFLHYRHVTLFKPNIKELKEGLKIDLDPNHHPSVSAAVEQLKEKLAVDGVMLTLSEHGIFIDYNEQKLRLPAHKREIADVSGAGDTVVCIAALCVALRLSPERIAQLSNLGGGLVCQHVGVVPIDKQELLSEVLELEMA